jgi:hypothetical protein
MDSTETIKNAKDYLARKRFSKASDLVYPILQQAEKQEIEIDQNELGEVYAILAQAVIGERNPDFFDEAEKYLEALGEIHPADPETCLFIANCYYRMKKELSEADYPPDSFLYSKYMNLARENVRLILKTKPALEFLAEMEMNTAVNLYWDENYQECFPDIIPSRNSFSLAREAKITDFVSSRYIGLDIGIIANERLKSRALAISIYSFLSST